MRALFVILLLAVGWEGSAAAQNLRIGGTGVGLELSRILAEEFSRRQSGIEIWLPDSLGSSGGIKALAASRLDVAVTLRSLKPADAVAAGQSVALCRTPMVFFAHATRGDIALKPSDLAGLFLSNLPPFPRGEVRPLLRPANETGFQFLQERFPDLVPAIEMARHNRAAIEAVSDQDAMTAVENAPALVAFGALAPILAEKRKLKVVSFDGQDPSRLPADYPYWIEVYLSVAADSSAQGRAFVEFARSPAAASLLRANGCLPRDDSPS